MIIEWYLICLQFFFLFLELILDEIARLNFIMVVGINTNQVKNFNEYLNCKTISSRVCRMSVFLEDITSEHVKNTAKEVVDKFQSLTDQLSKAAQNQKADSSEIEYVIAN